MIKYLNFLLAQIVIQLIIISSIFGQNKIYKGPDDPAGDIAAERSGYMDGNNIFLYFRNTTELSDWPLGDSHIWPTGNEGLRMTDGIAMMVGARVYVENDSIPVTDWNEITTRSDLDTLYYLQTSYREEMDNDLTGTIEWGFYPVFGYFNENNETPAMSSHPESWPPAGWPSQGNELKWPGEWNGKFGRGISLADLETFIVVNDAQDQEYLGREDAVKYYPRPGVFIGDKRPEVTIQKGLPWGGIGIRVEQRGFQWNNRFAKDIIFWEYTIANISDYDLPEIFLGYWVDNAIGGDPDDEIGFYKQTFDLAYSWDVDGVGIGGKSTGIMGFAYLETAGDSYDVIDNDDDGLIDEKRDNHATQIIGPYDGISDLNKFLTFYSLTETDLKEHWDADEDQDWDDGNDTNNNGIYDIREYAGDDIGLDGVGPSDFNYIGPDADGTECNHRPDFVEGLGCEPDFGPLDINESDMLGLTSFNMFGAPSHASGSLWFKNDKSMWNLLGRGNLAEYSGQISNLILTFASGNFPLYKGRQERISMAVLHAYDPLAGLNSSNHQAPTLFEKKYIAQNIYNNNYRFARAPEMPTLTATTDGHNVVLSWDDISETKTREPMLRNTNDFEGYKLYRATDPYFQEGVEWIYDEFGNPFYIKPIFQCDLIDGIQGLADYGIINGAAYYLGNETGILHQYVDRIVQNDKIYYYALVAYDYGMKSFDISPSENFFDIRLDENGKVVRYSKNVAIVDLKVGIQDSEQQTYFYSLSQNYPNPFNPVTTIKYSIAKPNDVVLNIYNLVGQEVETLVNDFQKVGEYNVKWTAEGLPSGIYLYKLHAGEFSETKKLILQK